MAKDGTFGSRKIRHFNGHVFEEATVFELTEEEIGELAIAGEAAPRAEGHQAMLLALAPDKLTANSLKTKFNERGFILA